MNPIIQRELIGLLRTRRAFAAQVILAAILTLLIVLRWPESGRVNISGEQAQEVLRLFGYGLLVSLILVAPVFPASAVVREKQQRTLELLLNSPLTPWSIFWGKLAASLGFILLLLLLSVPAAAACFAMGGVDTAQIFHVYMILLLVAVEYSVVALFVSTVAASSETALRYTYGAVLVLTLLPLIPQKFVQGHVNPLLAQITDTFACISPLPAMMNMLGDRNIGTQGLLGPQHVELRYCLAALIVVVYFIPLFLLRMDISDNLRSLRRAAQFLTSFLVILIVLGLAIIPVGFTLLDVMHGSLNLSLVRIAMFVLVIPVIFVRRITRFVFEKIGSSIYDQSHDAGKITDERPTAEKVYRRIMYLWFFDPQRRSSLIGPFTNPVMVKDFRSQKFGRAHWMMRFFVGCVVVSLGLMLATTQGTMTWGVETLGGMIVILQMAVVVLISPSLAAGAISSERESGSWTLLKMTPLSSFTIVLGKLLSAGRTLFLLLIATLPAYAVILVIDWHQGIRVAHVLLTVLLTGVFGLMASAAISSLFQRTTAATAVSYTLLVGLCGGTMLFWLGRGAPFSRGTVEAALRFNPVAAALQLIQAPDFKDYHLVPFNGYLLAGGIVLAGIVLWVQTWRLSRPQ